MNALPRPLSIVVQIVAALVAGVALSVFVGPVLENPSGAVGTGGSGGVLPGAHESTGLLGGPASGSGGNVGEVPNGLIDGGSGGILPGAHPSTGLLGGSASGSLGNVG